METSHFEVPWYSMEEWNLVYDQIYSNNIENMKKAYRRLFVWKTRVENLPAGVECTIGILQVRLREMEISQMAERLLSQEDLQLMYSTAIIRFLNMIAELEQSGFTSTLYYKAQVMDIPSWIVNLRHDASHSTTLPSLHSLKSAADFIFNWLNDHYWKNEAQHTHDYYIDLPKPRTHRRKIRNIFSLLQMYLDVATSKSKKISEKVAEKLTAIIPAFNAKDKVGAMNQIEHELFVLLKKEEKKYDILEHIVHDTEFFNSEIENTKYSLKLVQAWSPIFSILNKHNLLLDFMRLLIEVFRRNQDDEIRCQRAAMWINEISRGYMKLERCLRIQLDLQKRGIGQQLTAKKKFLLVLKVADRTYKHLRSAVPIKGKLPARIHIQNLLEETLRVPSEHTFVFLRSLSFLCHTPHNPLVDLINLYLNTSAAPKFNEPRLTQLFTVESLARLRVGSHNASQNITGDSMQKFPRDFEETMEIDAMQGGKKRKWNEEENIWRRAVGLDWLHCPVGTVPGDLEDKFLDIELLNTL